MPMPHTTLPMIWLCAVFVFRMRPAATALTTRVTRMTPSCSSTFTSAKIAECVLCECEPSLAKAVDVNRAQHPQQRSVAADIYRAIRPVYREHEGHLSLRSGPGETASRTGRDSRTGVASRYCMTLVVDWRFSAQTPE
jgi:hypothetical protein